MRKWVIGFIVFKFLLQFADTLYSLVFEGKLYYVVQTRSFKLEESVFADSAAHLTEVSRDEYEDEKYCSPHCYVQAHELAFSAEDGTRSNLM